MNDEIDQQDEIDETILLRDLKTMRENRCTGCGAVICGQKKIYARCRPD